MKLTVSLLRSIADQVDKLEKSGVRTDYIMVHGHRVVLKFNSAQRDGNWYEIIDISEVK